ncbi:hypothetical protein HMSSN139_64010 [Paenibacillus sp. HMSSN-139]|nr:hypothetical protein HMSSN139_64010 [Paenibacillus sp. HMSSN-139]
MPQNYDSRQGPVPPFYPYTQYYPGVNPYEIKAEASSLVPYSPPSPTPTQAPVKAAPKAGGGLSLPSLGDLKGIVDRMGGIEGILATMGQVQKVMQTVQQFAPMAKLFTAFLPGGKGKSAGEKPAGWTTTALAAGRRPAKKAVAAPAPAAAENAHRPANPANRANAAANPAAVLLPAAAEFT